MSESWGSELLYDLPSLPVIYELVLSEELTLIELSQTVDADLSSLQQRANHSEQRAKFTVMTNNSLVRRRDLAFGQIQWNL